jgi:hypothetical protein
MACGTIVGEGVYRPDPTVEPEYPDDGEKVTLPTEPASYNTPQTDSDKNSVHGTLFID